jgi:chemotaxis protein MotB
MKQILGLGLVLVLFSCVPLKQFNVVKDENNQLKAEAKQLGTENENLNTKNAELSGKLKRSEKQVGDLINDTVRLATEVHSLKEQVAALMKSNSDLAAQLKKMSPTGESESLMAYLQKLQGDLQKREDALRKAEKDDASKKAKLQQAITDLQASQNQLTAQNARLRELERALTAKDSAMNALKNAVANALTGFNSDELKVHIKNGKVYVSLEEKLLFASGSYEVNAQGASAIKKLGSVLESKSDIGITIEGHTDDVPYKSGVLIDNWDLSVKRATAVARILLQQSKVNPSRVTTAGRSQYVAVEKGTSAAARQKNRRTEIILTPGLDKLLDIIDSK